MLDAELRELQLALAISAVGCDDVVPTKKKKRNRKHKKKSKNASSVGPAVSQAQVGHGMLVYFISLNNNRVSLLDCHRPYIQHPLLLTRVWIGV